MVALWPGRMLPLMTMGHDALWHFRLLSNFILCSGCASEGFQSSGFRASNGLHGNNQITGEAQDALWKLEECKVRIADKPAQI
jgi:hypothetical protein